MIRTVRDVAVFCDVCGQAGPAADNAVEARALATEEGWKVDRRRAVPDVCDHCQ